MGILERTRHAVRADLNALVRKAKNPEAVLEAYLDDLQTVLEEAEALRAAEAAEREMYSAKLRDVQDSQATWEGKAKTCLKQGDEALARTALEHKLDLEADRRSLESELKHRKASLAVLDDSLLALRERITEVSHKRRELRYRRQVLTARSELQKAMGRLGTQNDEPILTEAEDGLSLVESRIEAAEALDGEDLDNRAAKLEAADRKRRRDRKIEDQLDALRAELDGD